MADDIRDLVVAPVVLLPERVHDAALHRLEAVVDVRHGAFQDHIAGVVEEPVAVEIVHGLVLHRRGGGQDRGMGVSRLGGRFFGHGAKAKVVGLRAKGWGGAY